MPRPAVQAACLSVRRSCDHPGESYGSPLPHQSNDDRWKAIGVFRWVGYTLAIQPNVLKATTSATTPTKSIEAVTVGVP